MTESLRDSPGPDSCPSVKSVSDFGHPPRHLGGYSISVQRRDYALKIAALHGLTDLFEAYAAKPDIIIDDMPGTAHPAFAFDVNREPGWPEMVRDILRKHVDPR